MSIKLFYTISWRASSLFQYSSLSLQSYQGWLHAASKSKQLNITKEKGIVTMQQNINANE